MADLESIEFFAYKLSELYAQNPEKARTQISNAITLIELDSPIQFVPFRRAVSGTRGKDMLASRCTEQETMRTAHAMETMGFSSIREGDDGFDILWDEYVELCSKYGQLPSDGTPTPCSKRRFFCKTGRKKTAQPAPDDQTLLNAFEAFDANGTPDGFSAAKKWFVSHPDTGLPYPAKIIWGLATSQTGKDFTAHQARDALRKCDLECAMLDPSDFPPDAPQTEPLVEGAERQTTRTVRERNSVARRLCIDHYRSRNGGRLACIVCNTDFSETYGEIGADFIHVHHLDSLAEADGARDVSPEHDLVPVCPNCHAMIHRHGTTRSIAEIRRLIERKKG